MLKSGWIGEVKTLEAHEDADEEASEDEEDKIWISSWTAFPLL